MGGKTKQSQRTKNNVRPSSSSRSAELLNSGMSLDGGIMTLGNGKPLPPLFPTLVATNLEHGLNPEFQMCIKKLNKKDPITRAKALQELCELVNSGDVEDVVAALPSWAHFYKILTADTDRKVRENTQVCHGCVVRACGRRTAPQLKALLPAWLQAQYDEHAPAQAQAQHSLSSTFPDSKLPEVISFCKAEVMAHLLDNLIGNAEAVVSKRIENAEERELQMSRIITSSLRGLEYFSLQLPRAHDAWLWAQLAPLLQANAFWKFAHCAPLLRAAWYGAVGRIVERYGQQFGDTYGRRTARALLGAAPGAPAALWTCLLQLMHSVQDWHTYLDKQELLVKRILDLLENGGWGDARHLSNMLLPLLAYLPKDILTKGFYDDFFNAVLVGLDKKNILNSKSERQLWITSLSECLRYLSIQQDEFVVSTVSSVHRAWLERVLAPAHEPPTRNHLIKHSATNMTALLKYWLKQSKQEENCEKYDQLVRNFWQNVGSTVLTQIDKSGTDEQEIGTLIDGHVLLLQMLKTTFMQEAKKQQSIKFEGDEQTVPEKSTVVTQQCDASTVQWYKHNLDEVVHKICAHYFDTAAKKQISSAILIPLITLLNEFDSKNLFLALARQFGVDSVYRFYEKVLMTWLSGDTMRCKAVVDIVFLLMKYLSEEEQDSMFDTFQQFPADAVEWCLSESVRHPQWRAVRGWLRGAARPAVRALAARAAAAPAAPAAAALLRACLRDAPDAQPLVSESCISEVLATLSEALRTGEGDALEACGALAARLARALLPHAAAPHYAQLVLQLFRLNVRVPECGGAWREVRAAWRAGAAALPPAARHALLRHVALLLHQHLLHDMDQLDITKIENIIHPYPYLFNRCDETDTLDDVTEIVAFTKQIFDLKDPQSNTVESYALRYECVTSQLNCLYDGGDEVVAAVVRDPSELDAKELTKTDLMMYVNNFLFRAIYLKSVLLHKINPDDEEEESGEPKTFCEVLLKDDYIQLEFCKIIYNYVVINSLHEGYAFWPHYDIIVQTKEKLDSLLADVIGGTSAELRRAVRSRLSELALGRGQYWACARRWYCTRATGGDDNNLPEGHKLEDIVSGNGLFHTLQASTKWSSDEDADYKTKYLVMLRSWYTAFGNIADDQLLHDVTRCWDSCNLDVIVNAYYKHNHTMLYDKDVSDSPWCEVVSNAAVVEFLTSMINKCGWDAPAHHWDFATITLCSLFCSVEKSKVHWSSTKVSLLCGALLRLLRAVRGFVQRIREQCVRRAPAAHVADLLSEWPDMFAPHTYYNLFSIIMHVLDSCTETEMNSTQIEVVGELIECTKMAEWDSLPQQHQLGELSLERLARCAADALQQPAHHAHKYLAHCLLQALAKPLVLHDAEKLSLWSEESLGDGDEEKERPTFSLDYFHDAFLRLHEIIDAALSTVILGEGTCEFVAMSDSYSMALGWFLLADVMATLCELARGDLTHHYIQIYRERNYAELLLTTALRLLPEAVFAFASDNSATAAAPQHCADMFLQLQHRSVREAARGGDVGALACRGVLTTLCGAGCGGARGWWGAAPGRAARLLRRVVCAFVSPHAVKQQLQHLHQRAHELEDTEIRIAWSSNEVTCIYNVEERLIELHVWLAPEHPLVPPRLAAPETAVPGANTQWVAMYLAYQNGTLLNALKMWTAAVSAKVEASPQCYICYCRLHPNSGRLPRVPCYQCKNRFHTLCLRKWFATSNKSSCPLCRSAF